MEHLSAISTNVSNFGTLARPARIMLESVTSQNNTFSQNQIAANAAAGAVANAAANAAANAKRTLREVLSSAG